MSMFGKLIKDKYIKECEYLGCDLTKTVLLMDLSASIFNNNHIQNTIGMVLLISEMTILDKEYLIINKRNPEFLNFNKDDNIFQKVEKVLVNCCQSSNIYLNDVNELINKDDVDLLVLSNKEIDGISNRYNSLPCRIIFWRYDSENKEIHSRSYILIKKIIEESEEFQEVNQDQSMIYKLMNFVYSR
ncbi:unnamed protein product [marine sediment metagenome]|uniref:Uncharacterized protein n=1 Tax=marine sediment metagenome TaxID=412755 RepID=X0USW6_9ZZZZ